MKPNQTIEYPRITAGVARKLDLPPFNRTADGRTYRGGGDQNGTAALIFFGHAGTGLGATSMPRLRSRFKGA